MRLVVDAGAAVGAALSRDGFSLLDGHRLLAPPLVLAEGISVLHELRWRGAISSDLADIARGRLLDAPIRVDRPRSLHAKAWSIADELGWAKTYDAEYVALARIRSVPLLTIDGRLRKTVSRLVTVIGPAEL